METRILSFFIVAVLTFNTLYRVAYAKDVGNEKYRLIESAAESWKAVSRWRIEYEAIPDSDTAGIPAHRIMAVSEPSKFYHLSAHFSSIHPWQVDPFCQEIWINNGKVCHRWPFNRTFSERFLEIGDEIGGTIEYDFLLTVIPRWPLTDYKMPINSRSGVQIIPLEAMRSTEYQLLPYNEYIENEECAIFERRGLDRIWVSKHKGVCVMRRDFFNLQSGRLAHRILTDKVEKVADGIWMPTEFQSQFFSDHEPEHDEIVDRAYQVRVLGCMLNDDVPLSIFTPVHRPGSLKFENDIQFAQVSPGGEDLLSDISDFMVSHLKLPSKPIANDYPYSWFLIGLCMGFIFARFLTSNS